MTTCERCSRPMLGTSCEPTLNAWRWGEDPEWPATVPCGDCGTPVGGDHHAGCLVVHCRVCGDQWRACEGFDHSVMANMTTSLN